MDPLDPLTEIINSGQAFSLAITLERIIWAMIGLFFLGAISSSITKGMLNKTTFLKKLFTEFFKAAKHKDEVSQQYSGDDN